MRAIIAIILVGSLAGGCTYFNKKMGLNDDNFVEELTEKLISDQLGIDIDLTPSSKEQRNI